MANATGSVLRVSGTIIDVEFPRESAPKIYNELQVILQEPSGKSVKEKKLASRLLSNWVTVLSDV